MSAKYAVTGDLISDDIAINTGVVTEKATAVGATIVRAANKFGGTAAGNSVGNLSADPEEIF